MTSGANNGLTYLLLVVWVCFYSGAYFLNHCAGSRGRGRGYRGRGSRGGSRGRGMGRGSRGRGRGSMGDHPEDEDDFYEDEMDVRFSPARGLRGWLVACKSCWRWLVRRRRKESIRWQMYVLNVFGYCFGIEETITWFKLKRHQRVISENYIFLPLVSQPLSSRPWRQGS